MHEKLPTPIQDAIAAKVDLFMGENCEWKFEIEYGEDYIEKYSKCDVVVIANNGFGDYLFLKKDSSSAILPEIYEFCHEGPEIEVVADDPHCLFGLKERAPANVEPPQYYCGSTISLGDRVIFRSFFRKKQAQVIYVPGVSPRRVDLEFGGISLVEAELADGSSYIFTVKPETNRLQKSIRLQSDD